MFNLTPVTARTGLLEQVISAVEHKQQVSRLWRLRVSVSVGIASVIALVPVVTSLVNAFAASNFGTYLGLVFSDTSVVLSSWRVIGASLLESLPAVALTGTLALVGVFLWSLRTVSLNNNFIV